MNVLARALRGADPRRWPRTGVAPTRQLEPPVLVEPPVDLASDDPLLAYLLRDGGAVDLDTVKLDSLA